MKEKKINNKARRKPDRPRRWSRLCGCLQNRRHISNTRKMTSQSRSVLGQQYSNLGLGGRLIVRDGLWDDGLGYQRMYEASRPWEERFASRLGRNFYELAFFSFLIHFYSPFASLQLGEPIRHMIRLFACHAAFSPPFCFSSSFWDPLALKATRIPPICTAALATLL